MTINEYLEIKGLSITKMAARCGATFHQLYNCVRGGRPSLKLALAIQHYTDGLVSPWDYLNEQEKQEIYDKCEKESEHRA